MIQSNRIVKKLIFILIIVIYSMNAVAGEQINFESRIEKYFAKIKNNPKKLEVFLQAMPKGADLHNHAAGSSMAENMIRYAKGDHLCIQPKTWNIYFNPSCPSEFFLDNVQQNPNLYNVLIDAWSMRHFHTGKESGHDHFFSAFSKYNIISTKHSMEIVSEIIERAGKENVLYLELMVTPDNDASGLLGKKIPWNPNLVIMRENILSNGLEPIVSDISKQLNGIKTRTNAYLHCGTRVAKAGCNVKVRYLYQVLREQPPEQVFAQLLAGFEASSKDSSIVGINMVQPEDGKISMRDYDLQMHMIKFLHRVYPTVQISLHAGELVPALVPLDGLRFHIREAVEIAGAKRIGHGVDITYENNSKQLLQEMKNKQIMVEINLTSNQAILGVSGITHPLPLYIRYDVPVALSTDDEGVLRTNLTEQYKIAVITYHFNYSTIKNLVRNSIRYSFLTGNNLWRDSQYHRIIPACANNAVGSHSVSSACKKFLIMNQKANLQWELEGKFNKFEKELAIN